MFMYYYLLVRKTPELKRMYEGKWAVITGGSQGIARAYAEEITK